jgi:hypothetical protein
MLYLAQAQDFVCQVWFREDILSYIPCHFVQMSTFQISFESPNISISYSAPESGSSYVFQIDGVHRTVPVSKYDISGHFPNAGIVLSIPVIPFRCFAIHVLAETTLFDAIVQSSGERRSFLYGLTNTVFELRKILALETGVKHEYVLLNKLDSIGLVETSIIEFHFASQEFRFRVEDDGFRPELPAIATASVDSSGVFSHLC